MRQIKLMADYDCFPLWEESPGTVGNIDPSDLHISEGLRRRLIEWSEEYDATLNQDDPIASGFESRSDEKMFSLRGQKLRKELEEELGPGYVVTYQA